MGEHSETSFDELPLAAKRRIDALCARYEAGWRRGGPGLDELCAAVAEVERPVLLTELLHIDVERRRQAGESPAAGDYLPRFPAQAAVIRGVLPGAGPGEAARPAGGAGAPAVPGYEVMEELGRGGMGVVYKARHVALNRMVALKFILSGGHGSARHRERFRREAEAVARLRHPNIVQIYDIGEVEGQVFLALEYAEAGSLRQRLGGAPVAPRAAAGLLEPLARAVQHAHRHGVVHRDLKPANVLLSPGGDSLALGNRPLPTWQELAAAPRRGDALPRVAECTPKLTDFGLAKLLDDEGQGGEAGAAGTPSYMAPEQAAGGPACGPEADVWALGATLYELLTGRPPFRAASAAETLRLVLEADPVPPSRLQPSVPRDLETICLTCLEKEPSRRYAGARELAKDLRHYLDGEPIEARAAGRAQRAVRWARRRPAAAALAAVGVGALLVAVGGLAGLAATAVAGREEARREASAEREGAEADRHRLRRQVASLMRERALAEAERGRLDEALHGLAAALGELPEGEGGLEGAIRRDWGAVRGRVWARSGGAAVEEAVSCLAVRPGSGELFTGTAGGQVYRRDGSSGRVLARWECEAGVRAIAFSGDGKRALVCHGAGASYRDAETGTVVGERMEHGGAVRHGALLPGGAGAVTGGEDGMVRRWDGAGRERGPALRHPLPVRQVAVAPGGKSLAVALGSDDGRRGAVWLWGASEKPRARALGHPGAVSAVTFSPDGEAVWTGCADGRVRSWGVVDGANDGLGVRETSEIVEVVITGDGGRVVAATRDGPVRAWDRATGAPVAVLGGRPPVALSADRKSLAVVGAGEVWTFAIAGPAGGEGRPAAGGAADLAREAEWLTGQARDAGGRLVALPLAEWRARRPGAGR